MRSSYCTYHKSSRALKTHELINAIFASFFFLSSYNSLHHSYLHEFTAIVTTLRMLGCHLVPDFWQFIRFIFFPVQCHQYLAQCRFPFNFNWFTSYYLHDLFFIASFVRRHVIEGSVRNILQSVSKQKSKRLRKEDYERRR